MDFCAVGVAAQAALRCDHSSADQSCSEKLLSPFCVGGGGGAGGIDRPPSLAAVCRLKFKCDETQRWKLPVFFFKRLIARLQRVGFTVYPQLIKAVGHVKLKRHSIYSLH